MTGKNECFCVEHGLHIEELRQKLIDAEQKNKYFERTIVAMNEAHSEVVQKLATFEPSVEMVQAACAAFRTDMPPFEAMFAALKAAGMTSRAKPEAEHVPEFVFSRDDPQGFKELLEDSEVCNTCEGEGEIYSGRDQHFPYFTFQPPEPIMEVCPECGGSTKGDPFNDATMKRFTDVE